MPARRARRRPTRRALGLLVERYPVDHTLDGPWPAAGPRRNARMLSKGRPDRGLAFGALWKRATLTRSPRVLPVPVEDDCWKHTGTGDMVARMLRAGLPVRWVAAPGAEAVELREMPGPAEVRA